MVLLEYLTAVKLERLNHIFEVQIWFKKKKHASETSKAILGSGRGQTGGVHRFPHLSSQPGSGPGDLLGTSGPRPSQLLSLPFLSVPTAFLSHLKRSVSLWTPPTNSISLLSVSVSGLVLTFDKHLLRISIYSTKLCEVLGQNSEQSTGCGLQGRDGTWKAGLINGGHSDRWDTGRTGGESIGKPSLQGEDKGGTCRRYSPILL